MTRLLSLCTGYGGLDLAVEQVFPDVELAYVADIDKDACKVIEHRFPGVPNIGDIKTVDWASLDPVNAVTAGYPCQPFSHAGKRQGEADERHLWPAIATAIGVLRPRLVFLENVAGHLGLGFDTVLADLARLGFDAEWCVVRASDVGACHQRARLFVLATNADSLGDGGEGRDQAVGPLTVRPAGGLGRPSEGAATDARGPGRPEVAGGTRGGQEPLRRLGAHADHLTDGAGQAGGGNGALVGQAFADPAHDGRQRSGEPRGGRGRPEDGSEDAAHAHGQRRQGQPEHDGAADTGEPAPGRHADGCGGVAAHADRSELARQRPEQPERADAGGRSAVAWGVYEPAIRRHELVLGRSAPAPLDDRGRLDPRLPEWMQMLDAGWVTDVPGLSRSAKLRIIGNGVVPPQAAWAYHELWARL